MSQSGPTINRSILASSDWRQPRYQRFHDIVDSVVEDILDLTWEGGKKKRRLRGEQLDKLTYSVHTIIRDCVAVVYQRKRKGEASIKLGQNAYSRGCLNSRLTYSIHVQRAYRGMKRMGYIEETSKGFHDRQGRKDGRTRSRLTRYVASDKLLDLFTKDEQRILPVIVPPKEETVLRIRVKQEENGVIRPVSLPVVETEETARMRRDLERINSVLVNNWYDLELSDEEMISLQTRLADDDENPRDIDMSRRTLYRVFNDPDLSSGGRFYGGWWQNIPKEYRLQLRVNGKNMVEFDYSNQHPAILYAEAGLERPADCYADILRHEQLPDHRLPDGKTWEDVRSMAKAAFNAMLNAKAPMRNAPEGIRPWDFGLKWKDVSEAVIAFHAPIAHHFYTGAGLRLQRLDSDIAEKVMLKFIEIGAPILPLHDSFLVHDGYQGYLPQAMEDAAYDVIGTKLGATLREVKPKLSADDEIGSIHAESDNDFGPETTDDLVALLTERSNFERRLSAFLSMRGPA